MRNTTIKLMNDEFQIFNLTFLSDTDDHTQYKMKETSIHHSIDNLNHKLLNLIDLILSPNFVEIETVIINQ